MDDRKYVCVEDYQGAEFLIGTAKTIEEWKVWLLKFKVEELYDISLLFDENAMEVYHKMVDLKENEVISYIRDYFDIKIVPLENKEQKYLIMDEARLITEKELRKMLLNEETQDIFANLEDYINGDLSLDSQLMCIKNALDSNIDNVIETLNSSWNIPVIKIKGA